MKRFTALLTAALTVLLLLAGCATETPSQDPKSTATAALTSGAPTTLDPTPIQTPTSTSASTPKPILVPSADAKPTSTATTAESRVLTTTGLIAEITATGLQDTWYELNMSDSGSIFILYFNDSATISINKTVQLKLIAPVTSGSGGKIIRADKAVSVADIDGRSLALGTTGNAIMFVLASGSVAQDFATGEYTELLTARPLSAWPSATLESVTNMYWQIGKHDGEYRGAVLNGKPEGYGTCVWTKDDGVQLTYTGDWKNGSRTGQGTLTGTDGVEYHGGWANGQFDGVGTLHLPSGDIYIGGFANNLQEGQGMYYWASGQEYSGDFVNGQPDGIGTMHTPKGDTYVGEFRNGDFDGRGTYTFSRSRGGKVEDGMWEKGKYLG